MVHMKDKKRQHYVWKHYLKPWSINGKIWCKRDGKIFNTSLENIAQKRFFYHSSPLNQFEENLIINLIKKMHSTSHQMHLSSYGIYKATSEGIDYFKKNGIEDYHSVVEGMAVEIIESLQVKDLSMLNNKQNKIGFCHFLGMQYTRTNRNQTNLVKQFETLPDIFPEYRGKFDPNKIAKVLALISANAIGNWIFGDGKFSIIENTTQIEFITCDQPIFNLEMNYLNEGVAPEKFKLYYPLTPNLALIIEDLVQTEIEVTPEKVSEFNDFMFSASCEQIYSRKKEFIEHYDN